jgi:hypothetical protein
MGAQCVFFQAQSEFKKKMWKNFKLKRVNILNDYFKYSAYSKT